MAALNNNYNRGDLILVNLSGSICSEIGNDENDNPRSCVIVSRSQALSDNNPLVFIVPFTTQGKPMPFHVKLYPNINNVQEICRAKIEHLRCIDKQRITTHLQQNIGDKATDIIIKKICQYNFGVFT